MIGLLSRQVCIRPYYIVGTGNSLDETQCPQITTLTPTSTTVMWSPGTDRTSNSQVLCFTSSPPGLGAVTSLFVRSANLLL